jgi:hypothetical protein
MRSQRLGLPSSFSHTRFSAESFMQSAIGQEPSEEEHDYSARPTRASAATMLRQAHGELRIPAQWGVSRARNQRPKRAAALIEFLRGSRPDF